MALPLRAPAETAAGVVAATTLPASIPPRIRLIPNICASPLFRVAMNPSLRPGHARHHDDGVLVADAEVVTSDRADDRLVVRERRHEVAVLVEVRRFGRSLDGDVARLGDDRVGEVHEVDFRL